MKRLSVAVGLALSSLGLAAGCASPTLYDWGDYQGALYRQFTHHDGIDPADEAHRLETQVEQTVQRGRAVPPGVQAHVGYLCHAAGDEAGAVAHLHAEKAAFPESAVFVDGMLQRMKK